jgi:ArsR family transcriptional regulator
MRYAYAEYVPLFKALADETRLKIVEMLCGGEMCVCKILEGVQITQPTLSYHMKILTEWGLVEGSRDGAWMKYTINKERFVQVKDFWNAFSDEHIDSISNKTK